MKALHVKAEEGYVAVLHHVFLTFAAHQTLFFGVGHGAAFHQIVERKDFRADEVDLCDKDALEKVFIENPDIDSAIHFAGLKAVGESVQKPGMYYYNNLVSTLNLVELLAKYDAKRIVFSSSATVYGNPKTVPIREDFPLSTTNPYGETKLMIERILKDVWVSDNDWSVSILPRVSVFPASLCPH